MNSEITASVKFDFKGKSYDLSAVVNCDIFLDLSAEEIVYMIYELIARENNIGEYSYELEVLMSEEILFSNPKGYIEKCFNPENNSIDFSEIKNEYMKNLIDNVIKQYNLENTKNIKDALIAVYKAK